MSRREGAIKVWRGGLRATRVTPAGWDESEAVGTISHHTQSATNGRQYIQSNNPTGSSNDCNHLFLSTHPPSHRKPGTAVTADSAPSTAAIVPHPLSSTRNPASKGPTMQPPANAQLYSA